MENWDTSLQINTGEEQAGVKTACNSGLSMK
jgi:hypothetical protein